MQRRTRRPSNNASPRPPRPVCAEPLEDRLLMAAALKLGGSGYSGTLSTNPTTRQQQLICDPNEPKAGSTSTSYDPDIVTPVASTPGPGYTIQTFVEVTDNIIIEGPGGGGDGGPILTIAAAAAAVGPAQDETPTRLVPLSDYLEAPSRYTQVGRVQVQYQQVGTDPSVHGQIEPAFTVDDEAGPPGVDTHALLFEFVNQEGPLDTTNTYRVYASPAVNGLPADFMITQEDELIPFDEISDAVVSSSNNPTGDFAPGVRVLPDPGRPGQQALFGFGSDASETISFTRQGNGLKATVTNEDTHQTTTYGPFTGFGRVIAYGRGGDDTIRMDSQGAQSVLFFGGDGGDTLQAGNGGSILSGGDGDDSLATGNGSDLLLGGRGTDTLGGGNGEDILVGEHTNFDEGTANDVQDLSRLFDEWTKGGKYEVRISHLTGAPGGSNGTAFFNLSGPNKNVWDDQADDVFNGGNGRDWIITGLTDATAAHDKNEIVSLVS